MGVSKMFTGEINANSGTATDTAVSVKSASELYTTIASALNHKADANAVVSSVNGVTGAVNLCVHNAPDMGSAQVEGSVYNSSIVPHANLWGMGIVAGDEAGRGSTLAIIDTFVGMSASYLTTANLPSGAVSVENNFVINDMGNVITTIRPERMVTGFSAQDAKGLKSFVGDLSNLTTATYGDGNSKRTFYECTALESFIGDLSSLEDGDAMFCGCSNLTTFISDLSSLAIAHGMFYGCKLNTESLECIADTLPTVTGGEISIGYGSLASEPDAQAAKAAIEAKGWTCSMTYNA